MYTRLALICITTALLATAATARSVHGAEWDAPERFQLRGRLIGVLPDEDSTVSVGGKAHAGNALTPELDLSYYLSDHFSAELIAATSQHSLSHSAAGDLGRTWILPPTVTIQYHPRPHEKFSPYVGAGLNYSFFYGENAANGNGVTALDVDGGLGYALQAGADYWISEHWGMNLDVKKLFLNVDADMRVGGAPVSADIDLDPWIVGAGVAYRF